jgi:hypothetical protein
MFRPELVLAGREQPRMRPEPHKSEQERRDPLEDNELARRLRRMKWPTTPPEVKQRVLERVLEEADGKGSSNGRQQD